MHLKFGIKMRCDFCQQDCEELLFKCQRCCDHFCSNHRFAENHFCKGSPTVFDGLVNWFSDIKTKISSLVSPKEYSVPLKKAILCGRCQKDLVGEKTYFCSSCNSNFCGEHNGHAQNHERSLGVASGFSNEKPKRECASCFKKLSDKSSYCGICSNYYCKKHTGHDLNHDGKTNFNYSADAETNSEIPFCSTCKKPLGGFESPKFCVSCNKHYCHRHDQHTEKHGKNTLKSKFKYRGKCTKCGIKLNVLNKTVCIRCGQVFCQEHSPEKNHRCERKIRSSGIGFMTTTYKDGTKISDTSQRGYV